MGIYIIEFIPIAPEKPHGRGQIRKKAHFKKRSFLLPHMFNKNECMAIMAIMYMYSS